MSIGTVKTLCFYKGSSFTDDFNVTWLYLNGSSQLRTSFPGLSQFFPIDTYASTSGSFNVVNMNNLCVRGYPADKLSYDPGFSTRTSPSGFLPVFNKSGTLQLASMASHTHLNNFTASPTYDASLNGVVEVTATTTATIASGFATGLSKVLVSGTTEQSICFGVTKLFYYIAAN